MTLNVSELRNVCTSFNNTSRARIIITRWLDILFLAIVATLLSLFLFFILAPYFPKFLDTTQNIPLYLSYSILILLLSLILLPCVRYGSFSKESCLSATFLHYPPFWLACILSIVAIFTLLLFMSNSHIILGHIEIMPVLLDVFIVLSLGASMAILYYKLFKYSSPHESRQTNQKNEIIVLATDDFKVMLKWIEEEKPIQIISHDCLNNKVFSERINEILRQSSFTVTIVWNAPLQLGKMC